MREPLLIPFAGFALGIVLANCCRFGIRELAAAGVVLVALGAVAHRRKARWLAVGAVGLAMVAAGALNVALHDAGPPPEMQADDGETLILAGCVVEPPAFTVDREQFVLELEPGARANVSLSVKEGDEPPRLRYGQRVEFDARVRRPRNYRNPGAFDYARYLARQQIYWTASARADTPIKTLPGECGSRLQAAIFALRTAALERIERLYAGDEYAAGMTEAILIGESHKLEKVWTEQFRRTGTYHALVISGMHIIVLAGTLLFLMRVCMVNEMLALLIAAVGAWVYAAVSGWSAPVVRAAAGFTLYLVGRYFYRRGRVLNLLSAIAIVYLAWDPGQLFDASFQLSFLCVAAIGAFAAPLTEWALARYRDAGRDLADRGRDRKSEPTAAEFRIEMRLLAETAALWTLIPERYLIAMLQTAIRFGVWVAEMAILSSVIQLALALPMAIYFHRLSITGVTANLAVVPLMNALVPIGFAAIFTGWRPLAALARLCLKGAAWVAAWHAQWEPAHRIPDPPLWLAIALTAALVAVGVAARMRSRWVHKTLAVAFALLAALVIAPFPPEVRHGVLELSVIDVGQGDGLLLTTPDGRVLLIDSGGFPPYGRKKKPNIDIGEDVISPYLWTRRIQHADVIVTTHAHEDHVGGLKALIANFSPQEIWTGVVADDSVETPDLKAAQAVGVRILERLAGETFYFGGAHFEVLAPSPDRESNPRRLNNDSLALRVSYGRHSFLLTGDLEREVEYELLSRGVLAKTTVLKVAHHGSKTSSTPDFLDATQPEFAVISAGYLNMFRLPHRDVLDRLAERHADVLRTDRDGLITIRSDGRRITVQTMDRDFADRRFAEPFQAW